MDTRAVTIGFLSRSTVATISVLPRDCAVQERPRAFFVLANFPQACHCLAIASPPPSHNEALGAIFESLTSVCMLVSVELNEPKWKYVRATVAKFGIASIDLLVQAARQREDLERLVDTEFLSEVYVEALQKLSDPWERPLVCWAWIMRICMSAMDYNRTAAPRTTEVMKRCLAAKDGMLVGRPGLRQRAREGAALEKGRQGRGGADWRVSDTRWRSPLPVPLAPIPLHQSHQQ
ncbi:unnamed protein product [Prorocentrum cordatum]|uniref:Uncharacterized protein n=1 Tax=Prorocentrum cordatum TaxID=2364126 RepID=A0ABN9P631_9DINO|nr:unnamed protein product [Polarella glacialis]